MMNAVLPGMRSRCRGTIVNVISVAARLAISGSGYYSATKFTLEGVADALRREVKPLGIRGLIVQPRCLSHRLRRPLPRRLPNRHRRLRWGGGPAPQAERRDLWQPAGRPGSDGGGADRGRRRRTAPGPAAARQRRRENHARGDGANQALVDLLRRIAHGRDATPARVALA